MGRCIDCEAYLHYCVKVRKLGEGERDTERGPASPPPAKRPSLLKRAYDLTMGNPADSTVSSANSSARSASAKLSIGSVALLGSASYPWCFLHIMLKLLCWQASQKQCTGCA